MLSSWCMQSNTYSQPGEYKVNVFSIPFDLPLVILPKTEEIKHHAYQNEERRGEKKRKEREQKKCLHCLPIQEFFLE